METVPCFYLLIFIYRTDAEKFIEALNNCIGEIKELITGVFGKEYPEHSRFLYEDMILLNNLTLNSKINKSQFNTMPNDFVTDINLKVQTIYHRFKSSILTEDHKLIDVIKRLIETMNSMNFDKVRDFKINFS